MKILVTNDDGVYSPGLWAAVEALRDIAEVVVVAPDRELSGVGGSVTLHSPVRAMEVEASKNGTVTYAVEGTPADCVILAMEKLVGKVDLLVSGINKGANVGADVLISGTVGAALQGYARDVPSVAISVAALKATRFDTAAQLLRGVAEQVQQGSLVPPLLLNINLPDVPPEEINGIEVTRLAQRSFIGTVSEGDDGRRPYYWIARGKPKWRVRKGTDIWALRRRRCVSITPLHADMTAVRVLSSLKGLPAQLLPALRAEQAKEP
ncbi:MAG: 5'/3'-nucleotidase SurE [Chloroflexi bacterium]|nr:5'/3'-nucleotidase SurE [Chloroflexota bacterium]MCZ6789372.1 5'/3'-nucleotidase SurE [Chloroflexota bacterium]